MTLNNQQLIDCLTKKYKLISLSLCLLAGIFLLPKTAYLADLTSDNIINLSNQERQADNAPILKTNSLLYKAAYNKALDIFKYQAFEHNLNGQKFSNWIKDVGYEYSYVGENLAIDFTTSEGVMSAWLKSPLHKKNILNPDYEEIGVAIMEGLFKNEKTTLVVQIFGSAPKTLSPQISGINNFNEYSSFSLETNQPAYSYDEKNNALSSLVLQSTVGFLNNDQSQINNFLNNINITNKKYMDLLLLNFATMFSTILLMAIFIFGFHFLTPNRRQIAKK